MRRAFGKALTEIILKDPSVFLIVGDIGFSIFDQIRAERPKQFLNIGIMEQSMVGIAAGMALQGFKPWCFTITPFLLERAFEQIKIDIDANNVNVQLVGYCDYPKQGVTHSEMLKFDERNPFKNIHDYYPKNYNQAYLYTYEAYQNGNPHIISLKKDRECV